MIDSEEMNKLNRDLDKIGKKLFESVAEIPDSVTRELAIGANDIRNTIITSMRDTPKTGRTYRRGKSGKVHTASSPGNPPAIDYGELVRSIMFDVRDMEIEVGSMGGAPYAVFLEEGTAKMEARPFLDPAVIQHKQAIIDRVGDVAFEVIKGSFK